MKTTIATQLTIGQGVKIVDYSTKQQGYGRQSLYVDLIVDADECQQAIDLGLKGLVHVENVYVKDVFPNVLEHYNDSYILIDDTGYNEDEEKYYASSEPSRLFDEDEVFDTVEDLLNIALNGEQVDVEFDINQEYIIAWENNGTSYVSTDGGNIGTTIREQAMRFDSKEEAQEYIDACCGDHVWIEEYYFAI